VVIVIIIIIIIIIFIVTCLYCHSLCFNTKLTEAIKARIEHYIDKCFTNHKSYSVLMRNVIRLSAVLLQQYTVA